MSSNRFCSAAMRRALSALCLATAGLATSASASEAPFWRVGVLSGDALGCLLGAAEARISVVACNDRCVPIPWQLDERNAQGDLALDAGAEPTRDDPPGIVDANDELLWMASDAGRRMRAEERPASASCGLKIALRGTNWQAWIYAFVLAETAPRSPNRYVSYDPATDTVAGARVALGFGAPTPRFLAVRTPDGSLGPNLLDRLKVRASARFLGVVPLGRDEDDIQWIFDGWRAGPIRVVRRERQWVRLGWGLRTPIFRTESLVYRDRIELPVRLRLNFPPAYFFRAIEVQAGLDFRDLRGWRLLAPGLPPLTIGAADGIVAADLEERDAAWLGLSGPQATLMLQLQLAESLASLRVRLLARENRSGFDPEAESGERPAVGFRLTDWNDVDRGHHGFSAISTALPADYDVARFLALDQQAIVIDAQPLAPP